MSAKEAPDPEDFWTWLDSSCVKGSPECDVFSIPHNSNVSNSAMFALHTSNGDPIDKQIATLRDGVHIVVGTPGRVLDLLKRGELTLSSVKNFVLDEADKMLDMGFAQEMSEIMAFVPEQRQTSLFSATVPLGILSVVIFGIAFERLMKYRGLEAQTRELTRKLVDCLVRRDLSAARTLCEASKTPMAEVFGEGLRWRSIA